MVTEAKLLRVFFGEDDLFGGRPLYEALIEACRERGIAGATAFRAFEGFGHSAEVHRPRRFKHEQPMVIEIIDNAANIAALLPIIEQMMGTGTMTVSTVDLVRSV